MTAFEYYSSPAHTSIFCRAADLIKGHVEYYAAPAHSTLCRAADLIKGYVTAFEYYAAPACTHQHILQGVCGPPPDISLDSS